jgi:hypothetical protein
MTRPLAEQAAYDVLQEASCVDCSSYDWDEDGNEVVDQRLAYVDGRVDVPKLVKAVQAAAVLDGHERAELERLRWLYEGCARVLCRQAGFDPLDSIADGGHLAWHLHGYEVACKEMGRKS